MPQLRIKDLGPFESQQTMGGVDYWNVTQHGEKLFEIVKTHSVPKHVWKWISIHQKLSEEFILKYKNNLTFEFVIFDNKINVDNFIDVIEDQVPHSGDRLWENLCKYQKLSEKFMRDFSAFLIWELVSSNQTLSEKFIEDFQDKVVWNKIFKHQKLSEKFIEKFVKNNTFKEHLTDSILKKELENNISLEEIALKYDGLERPLNISDILSDFTVPEKFLERDFTNSNWYMIAKNQELSEDFIRRHHKDFDKSAYNGRPQGNEAEDAWSELTNNKLSLQFIEDFAEKINWDSVSLGLFRDGGINRISNTFFEKMLDMKKIRLSYSNWIELVEQNRFNFCKEKIYQIIKQIYIKNLFVSEPPPKYLTFSPDDIKQIETNLEKENSPWQFTACHEYFSLSDEFKKKWHLK